VIHALGGEQDMRRMGALKDKIPITHWTMFVGSVAIAGIPGFAGFFSKDEILWQAYSSKQGSNILYVVGLVTAGLTAFYMWRLMNMTFYGKSRVTPEVEAHVHESPATMTIPLSLLALGSVLAGWIGTPKLWGMSAWFRGFEQWLEPAFTSAAIEAANEGAHDASTEWILMGVSVAIALIGISIARYFYHHRPHIPDRIEATLAPLHGLLLNKWYVDELYDFLFVNGFAKGGGTVLGAFDRNVVDGAVNGAGWLTRLSATISMWWDTWIVDGTVRLTSLLVKLSSYPVRIVQTGRVQAYALFVVVGALAFFGYYIAR
jgi:NADH-quinone oxidoreductase subunit L